VSEPTKGDAGPVVLEGELLRWRDDGLDTWLAVTQDGALHTWLDLDHGMSRWIVGHDDGADHEARKLLAATLAERDRTIAELTAERDAEVHDLQAICHEVSLVYDHITGGMIGKPNTHAFEVIAVSEERENKWVEVCIAEATENLRQERDDVSAYAKAYRDTLLGLAIEACKNFPDTCASKGIAYDDLTCNRCFINAKLERIDKALRGGATTARAATRSDRPVGLLNGGIPVHCDCNWSEHDEDAENIEVDMDGNHWRACESCGTWLYIIDPETSQAGGAAGGADGREAK
jgi:hypothetical protein